MLSKRKRERGLLRIEIYQSFKKADILREGSGGYISISTRPAWVLTPRSQIPSIFAEPSRRSRLSHFGEPQQARAWAVNFLRVIEKAYWFGKQAGHVSFPRSGAMLDEGSLTDAVLRGERRSLTLCKPLTRGRNSARFLLKAMLLRS
jgi:hypothetical protein